MIVIVTGASRGLGLAILRLLLQRKVQVTTLSRTITPELRELAGADLEIVQGDVGIPADNQRAIDLTIKRWGRIDALVLNAGTIAPSESLSMML
jgi:NAD(P)-dependent dehydrogenase (short-subunit alcohol dehydrogenase family)